MYRRISYGNDIIVEINLYGNIKIPDEAISKLELTDHESALLGAFFISSSTTYTF